MSAYRDISQDLLSGIFYMLEYHIQINDDIIPVYKSIPKQPPQVYIFIGNVTQTEDGTKDNFIYYGTVQVQVIDESKERADLKQAQDILNLTRNWLKPSRSEVFEIGTSTLTVLKPESFNYLVSQSENGISKVQMIDVYNYIIT